jgi:cytoskeletal protein RodZ
MPSIGETLREARMRQRLDIADVERQTKIRAKYLRALENEEFSMLPGPTFVKTFLRTYAEQLGLDPHALVEEYRAEHEPRDELETLKPLGPRGGRDRRGGPPRLWIVALLLSAAVLAGLVALGLSVDDEDPERSAQATETAPRTERTTTAKQEQPPPPQRVVVRVTPSTATYVCADTGPGTEVTFEGTLESARTFRGRRLRLNLGKTSVEVRVNGRPLPIEQGPEPVGYEFTPGSTRELPVGQRPCA